MVTYEIHNERGDKTRNKHKFQFSKKKTKKTKKNTKRVLQNESEIATGCQQAVNIIFLFVV